MTEQIPVLIVGAGPAGMLMAILLKKFDIPFRIIDKQIKPVVTSNALAVQTRTLEIYDDLELLEAMNKRGNKMQYITVHMGTKEANIDMTAVNSLYRYMLGISQHETEALFLETLSNASVNVEMNVELTDFNQENEGVVATLRHQDGHEEKVNAAWLIGCDGSRSFVRIKSNIEFEGKELSQHFVLADVKLKSPIAANAWHAFASEKGLFILAKYHGDECRFIVDVSDDEELKTAKTVSFSQLKRLVAERCQPLQIDFDEPTWTSGFWIHERQAAKYRLNRIFLSGDAAHIHSPAGGQGMNTGLQDVYNLAWKLALVIKGKAKSSILDSYHDERYPTAHLVLERTTLTTHIMTTKNPILSTLRNYLFIFLTSLSVVQKRIATIIAQLNVYYKNSPIIKDHLTSGGPRAGEEMIDVIYADQRRLMDFVRGVQHVLLCFMDKTDDVENFLILKARLQKRYPQLIKFVLVSLKENVPAWAEEKTNGAGSVIFDAQEKLHAAYHINTPSIYLLRPDKYIGFRGRLEDEEALYSLLEKIFI